MRDSVCVVSVEERVYLCGLTHIRNTSSRRRPNRGFGCTHTNTQTHKHTQSLSNSASLSPGHQHHRWHRIRKGLCVAPESTWAVHKIVGRRETAQRRPTTTTTRGRVAWEHDSGPRTFESREILRLFCPAFAFCDIKRKESCFRNPCGHLAELADHIHITICQCKRENRSRS